MDSQSFGSAETFTNHSTQKDLADILPLCGPEVAALAAIGRQVHDGDEFDQQSINGPISFFGVIPLLDEILLCSYLFLS